MNAVRLPECGTAQYTVFTKSSCKYCDNIKVLMDQENEDVEFISCDAILDKNREYFIKLMKGKTKKQNITFPIVFYGGEYVGGFDNYQERVNQRYLCVLNTDDFTM